MKPNQIKALNPAECPFCHQEFIIEFSATAPQLTGIYTPEVIENGKKEALKQIEALNLSKDKTEQVIEWINNPSTIFSPEDIGEIIKNLQKENDYESGEEK